MLTICCVEEARPAGARTMGTSKTLGPVRGFTLIELLIAIAVVGILASIAIPSYTSYARRGKIALALGELGAVRVKLEQYYQDNRNYGTTASSCPVPMPSASGFAFTCAWGASSTSQSFLLTATGTDGMAGYVYTVNETDQQKTAQFDGNAVNAPCWMKKQGDTC